MKITKSLSGNILILKGGDEISSIIPPNVFVRRCNTGYNNVIISRDSGHTSKNNMLTIDPSKVTEVDGVVFNSDSANDLLLLLAELFDISGANGGSGQINGVNYKFIDDILIQWGTVTIPASGVIPVLLAKTYLNNEYSLQVNCISNTSDSELHVGSSNSLTDVSFNLVGTLSDPPPPQTAEDVGAVYSWKTTGFRL